jgi:phosphoserine aminotransferase
MRAYNFSAGPAMLPEEVLIQVHEELLDWQGLGASVMEISHRGEDFRRLAEESEKDLRELLAVPQDYHVLFVQGGGRGQFSMVPMNLLRGKTTADYINTGVWSGLAAKEAAKYCQVNQVSSAESLGFTTIPEAGEWALNSDAAYLHIVDNETVNGVEYPVIADRTISAENSLSSNQTSNAVVRRLIEAANKVPLVADMSSNILSRPFDVSRYGLVYAGVQKNIGPAALAVVIVRKDLVGQAMPGTPCLYDYQNHVDQQSLYNTPPTFSWYVCSLVFKWLKKQGGVAAMAEINARKAAKLYEYIDQSDCYYNNIDPRYRSRMNVVFRLRDETKYPEFLAGAKSAGLLYLKGHQLVGGLRASIYNAMPEAGVDALLNYMADFAR